VATRPFVVNLTALRRSHDTRVHEQRRGRVADISVTGSRVPDGAEAVVDIDIDVVDGGVVAAGTVTAPWVGECRRCLGTAEGEVRVTVRELFEQDSDLEESYPLHGDQIDLEPLVRDAVLLELPLTPLCSEECQGLCSTCGANRNEGDCGHSTTPIDSRWASLDVLKD
jgi:uncharacterized protein